MPSIFFYFVLDWPPCIYSQPPEIEFADLFQCRAGLNLSQFQADYAFRINSSTATKDI